MLAVLTFGVCALPVIPAMLRASTLRPTQFIGFNGWLLESVYTFRGLAMQLISQPHQIGLWPGRLAILLA
ncbi:MAG: hypothetical protein WHU94_17130, partial [Thermogemmata sp.]